VEFYTPEMTIGGKDCSGEYRACNFKIKMSEILKKSLTKSSLSWLKVMIIDVNLFMGLYYLFETVL